jgi:uncharacterized Fe-S radical SAM superfamily protein PflX
MHMPVLNSSGVVFVTLCVFFCTNNMIKQMRLQDKVEASVLAKVHQRLSADASQQVNFFKNVLK